MVSVAGFGGFCARTYAVVLKSYLDTLGTHLLVRTFYLCNINPLSLSNKITFLTAQLCSRSGQKSSPIKKSLLNLKKSQLS